MNTKRLLVTALLLGSLWSAPGQYSGHVVGYYTVALTNGYNFVANQLNAPDNSLHLLIPTAPSGLRAYVWDVTNQVFLPRATYGVSVPQWDRTFDLSVGRGIILHAPTNCTVTFVGEVLEGGLTNFIAGGNKLSFVASMVPQAGALSSVLAFPGLEGASVHLFKSAAQSFSDACTYFSGHGWYDPAGVATAGGPVCAVGESFLVRNPGPETNWVRHFVVPQSTPSLAGHSGNTPAAAIRQCSISGGRVTLSVANSEGGPYNVNFSTDGVTWRTLAKSQTGATWSGPLPDAAHGYFQLSRP